MIATLIQTIIFLSYTIFITIKFGIIHSISESWYKFKESEKVTDRKLRALFTFFSWGIGFPMIWQMNPAMDSTGWIWFLSAAGFAFSGAATAFKSKGAHTDVVHKAGSAVGIGAALVGLGVQYNLWILLYIGIPLAIIILLVAKYTDLIKQPVFWLEILAAVEILIGLWIK